MSTLVKEAKNIDGGNYYKEHIIEIISKADNQELLELIYRFSVKILDYI